MLQQYKAVHVLSYRGGGGLLSEGVGVRPCGCSLWGARMEKPDVEQRNKVEAIHFELSKAG